MPTVVESARLRLVPYSAHDEDHFVTLFRDERVTRWMGVPRVSDKACRALFRHVFRTGAPPGHEVWGVWWTDRYVGHAEIRPTSLVDGYEIVYALRPDVWGGGLGTELARALVTYGLETLGLPSVYATVGVANAPSLAILDNLGFQRLEEIDGADADATRVMVFRPEAR